MVGRNRSRGGGEPTDFDMLVEGWVRDFDTSGITDKSSRLEAVGKAAAQHRAELLERHGLDQYDANAVLDRFVKRLAARFEAEGLASRRRPSGGGMTSVLWRQDDDRLVGHVDPGRPSGARVASQPVAAPAAHQSDAGDPSSAAAEDRRAFDLLMSTSEVAHEIAGLPKSQTEVLIERLEPLEDNTALASRTLGELGGGSTPEVTVLGVLHSEDAIPLPAADFALQAGDAIVVMGSSQAIRELQQRWH